MLPPEKETMLADECLVQTNGLEKTKQGFDKTLRIDCFREISEARIATRSNLTYTEGIESLIQLPRFPGFRNRVNPKRVVSVDDYGAVGDGLNDDTQAFKDAWKVACSFSAKSRIIILANSTYHVRPVDFGGPCRPRVTLRVSGMIVAPKDPETWHGLNPRKWLYFHGLKRFTIEGGMINGMGQKWWARSCKINKKNPCRHAPTAITFHRCKYLRVRNLTVVNSQQMHIAFTKCGRVVGSHLKVIAPGRSPNTDGIHISASTHVEIKNSIIKTGDDCISIVSNSSVVQIRNISCGPGHGISIGSLGKSKSWSQVHDVRVDGAFLSNTENGLRIKTWQGGRGFARKISFRNVRMDNVSNPIIIDQYYCDSSSPCSNQTLAVKVEALSFVGIKGTSATEEAVRFACSDNVPCESLYLEDIQLKSYTGGITRSFCWEAYGSSSGLVYPPPCLTTSIIPVQER